MAEQLILRDRLRALGYDAALVNFDCFDIQQGSRCHYLSNAEAKQLAEVSEHPVDLFANSEQRGLNRWYDFGPLLPSPKPLT